MASPHHLRPPHEIEGHYRGNERRPETGVRSQEGRGSTFTVRLPTLSIRPVAATGAPAPAVTSA